MASWRRIVHPPASAAWNMAVDETLLASCAAGESPPTLRCYGWAPPALSLGAHQEVEAAADRTWLREHGVDLVRRPTGGRAVLHAEELTYAVAAPHGPEDGGVSVIYARIAQGLLEGLRILGLEAELVRGRPSREEQRREALHPCFHSPARYELVWKGRKLVGSAQRQVEGAYLQHGSIPLVADEESVRLATGNAGLPGGWMAGLEEAVGRRPSFEETAEALGRGFELVFGGPGEPSELSTAETRAADRLARDKYATDDWTLHRGRVPGEVEG